jgi:hypothetical protein
MTKLSFMLPLLFVIVGSCTERSTNLQPEENLEPGRRDYVWNYDTIPSNGILHLWASSPDDIWGVDGSALWHYDSTKKWTRDERFFGTGLEPRRLLGFSKNNVWFMGTGYTAVQTFCARFNGSTFEAYPLPVPAGADGITFQGICGDNPNDFYAVGYALYYSSRNRPLMLHFNGTAWNLVNTPFSKGAFDKIIKPKYMNGKYLVSFYMLDSLFREVYSLYEFDNNSFKEVRSGFGLGNLEDIGGYAFYSHEGKAWKYQSNQFSVWRDFSTEPYRYSVIYGRNEKDMFIPVTYSDTANKTVQVRVLHYNGTDYQEIFKPDEGDGLFVMRVLPKDVLIPINRRSGDGRTVIAHGQLP